MAVFFDSAGGGDRYYQPILSLAGPLDLFWKHTVSGSETALVVAVAFRINAASIGGVSRKCWFGTTEAQSLGVKTWGSAGTAHGWTELFGLLDPPGGTHTIHVSIVGGVIGAGKVGRGSSVSYNGVSDFGTVTNAASSSGTVAVSGTAPTASKLVAAFGGEKMGFVGFNKTQRYLSNTTPCLVVGDADGTGSSATFSVGVTNSYDSAGLAVVVAASDIVATATGVSSAPAIQSSARRYPRPGVTRRAVFAAEPES